MRCPTCKREVPAPATICPLDNTPLLAALADTLKRGPLSLPEAAKIIERLCLALKPIHDSRIAHGRLSPENIFFRHVGSDISVQITGPDEARPLPPARYGTPERARGEKETISGDLYALGALFHHMIAGAPPFDSGTEAAILKKHADATPPSLMTIELQDVPEELDKLIRQLLAKYPNTRPKSVDEIIERLENIDSGSTITGAKLAALAANVRTEAGLEEATIEAKAPAELLARPFVDEIEHPTSLDIDPYGDTVVRSRQSLQADDDGSAETHLRIETRPQLVESDPTEPPRGPRSPMSGVIMVKPVGPVVPVAEKKAEARGPTLRTQKSGKEIDKTKLALVVLMGALLIVISLIAIVIIAR
jgi:serine/threonine protein kinase